MPGGGRRLPHRGAVVSSVGRAAPFRFQQDVGFRRPQGGGSERGGGVLPPRGRQPGGPGRSAPPPASHTGGGSGVTCFPAPRAGRGLRPPAPFAATAGPETLSGRIETHPRLHLRLFRPQGTFVVTTARVAPGAENPPASPLGFIFLNAVFKNYLRGPFTFKQGHQPAQPCSATMLSPTADLCWLRDRDRTSRLKGKQLSGHAPRF